LPALAPDRGTVISVRVAAKQSDDKPYFMIVSADIAKSEDPSKNPIHALTEAAKPNTDYAATADGCEFWEVCVDVDAPLERIVVLQSWRDAAAGKAFMGNPHLKLWRESTMAASAKSGFAAGIPLH
jgi:quinol monooxygenase YgiN